MPALVLALIAAFASSCAAPSGADRETRVFTPDRQEGETDFRVALIEPARLDGAAQERQPLTFRLFDARDDAPVEDATVFVESLMLEHGHVAADEEDPLHASDGLYRGEMRHSMAGNWEVQLEGVRANGDAFWLAIRLKVD
jgi:hypothetical protein